MHINAEIFTRSYDHVLQILMSVLGLWMTVTTMQTVITPLAPSTVPAILASLGMAEIVVGHIY